MGLSWAMQGPHCVAQSFTMGLPSSLSSLYLSHLFGPYLLLLRMLPAHLDAPCSHAFWAPLPASAVQDCDLSKGFIQFPMQIKGNICSFPLKSREAPLTLGQVAIKKPGGQHIQAVVIPLG